MTDGSGIRFLLNAAHLAAERALADADVILAAQNAVRARRAERTLDVWDALDEQVGQAASLRLREQLIELRRHFAEAALAGEATSISMQFSSSAEAGWRAWRCAVADAVAVFRIEFATDLCKRIDFPENTKEVREAREALSLMSDKQWGKACHWIDSMAKQAFLEDVVRAKLLVLRGEIEMYYLGKDASESFREAEQRAPNEVRVVAGRGDFYLHRDNEEQARLFYQRAINLAPQCAFGYVGMGELEERRRNLQAAEVWYSDAIKQASGDPLGYTKLLKLYGREDLFGEREADMVELAGRAVAVAPDAEYQTFLDVGDRYAQNKRFEDALVWYRKIPQDQGDWSRLARAKAGWMLAGLGRHGEAEVALMADLRRETNNSHAKEFLQALASDYDVKLNDRERAIRLYGELLEVLGDSYSGDYHNYIGNIHYQHGEYELAAAEYRLAIAAAPHTAVFCGNLASALEELRDYSGAEDALAAVFALDKDKKRFDKRVARLRNALGNDLYSRGDYAGAVEKYAAALELSPDDDVIWSNLGGAWEQSEHPGTRLAALQEAHAAFSQAHSKSGNVGYAKDIERVERKQAMVAAYGEKALDWVNVVTPIAIEVARDLIPLVEDSSNGALRETVSQQLTEMRTRIRGRFGVRVPGVRVRGNETDLPDGNYVIMLSEIPIVSGNVPADERYFPGDEETLRSLGVNGNAATNPLTQDDGFWIKQGDWLSVEKAGHRLWDPAKYLIHHIEAVVQRNLVDFLGHQEVDELLRSLPLDTGGSSPVGDEHLTALTTVCRALVAENVPITAFDEICSEFGRLYAEGSSLQPVVESIRKLPALRPLLCGNDGRHTLLRCGLVFEAAIRGAIYRTRGHAILAMEPERCQEALTAVRNALHGDRRVALQVEDSELRPHVRRLIELEFPHIPVLSRSELDPGVRVEARELELPGEQASGTFRAAKSVDAGATEKELSGLVGATPSIKVFVNPKLLSSKSRADDQPMEDMIALMRDGLFYELGLIVPQVQVEQNRRLGEAEFRIQLNGRDPVVREGLEIGEFLVNDTPDRLTLLSIKGREAHNPANGSECAIVRDKKGEAETCQQAGLTTWGPRGFLILALSAEIRQSAPALLSLEGTRHLLDLLQTAFPVLVERVVQRFTVEKIWRLLRELLDEEISIRDLRAILESMLAINGTTDVDFSRYVVFVPYADNLCPAASGAGLQDLGIPQYCSFVRSWLKRYISHKYTRGGNTLVVYLLDQDIERRVEKAISKPLTKEETARLKSAVESEVGHGRVTASSAVVITNMEIRKSMRRLMESDFPQLAVLSYQELSPDLNIQPIARISWA